MSDVRRKSNEELEQRLAELEGLTIPFQQKVLSADVFELNTTIAELTFNNLEVGKIYRLSMQAFIAAPNGENVELRALNGGQVICAVQHEGASTADDNMIGSSERIFPATDTTVTFVISGVVAGGPSGGIAGSGSRAETFVQLEELPLHVETDKWT